MKCACGHMLPEGEVVACTACGRCVADAPEGLITIENKLAVIDYSKNSLASRLPIERCPTGAIVADGVVEDHEVEPQCRGSECRRRCRLDHRPGDVATADFGAAAILDDRLVTRQRHQEQHVFRIGALAGRTERTNVRPIQAVEATAALPGRHQAGNQAEAVNIVRAQRERTFDNNRSIGSAKLEAEIKQLGEKFNVRTPYGG